MGNYHACAVIGINLKHESRISSNIPCLKIQRKPTVSFINFRFITVFSFSLKFDMSAYVCLKYPSYSIVRKTVSILHALYTSVKTWHLFRKNIQDHPSVFFHGYHLLLFYGPCNLGHSLGTTLLVSLCRRTLSIYKKSNK